VTGLRSLLRLTECPTLSFLSDIIEGDVEPAYCELHGIGRFACEGIEVHIGDRGTGLLYPFAMAELWSVVADLEAEYDAGNAYQWLADEIEEVEGIHVHVDIDYSYDVSLLKAKHRRRPLDRGVEVQAVPPYPYKRAMTGGRTYGDWEAERFRRNFPGLDVSPFSPDGTVILGDTKLPDFKRTTGLAKRKAAPKKATARRSGEPRRSPSKRAG